RGEPAPAEPRAGGEGGQPPGPGRLRRHEPAPLSPWAAALVTPIYRVLCDPDGRPRAMRRTGAY
ncbi:hypothetical protein ACFOWE_13085, partial [Planomonospora corallina]